MEAFLATNESQWEVIKKVIDECDYYILIIGGRYGTTTKEGISYTEKEFNYAKSISVPALCFVHGEPDNIAASKSEGDQAGRDRLTAFRNRVMEDHPVRKWTNAYELGGLVSRSLSRAIKVNPRPGWMRNTGTSNLELLEKINFLTTENAQLKSARDTIQPNNEMDDDLQKGDDTFELSGSATIIDKEGIVGRQTKEWKSTASWDDVFADFGPLLINETTETRIREMLARFIGWSNSIDFTKFNATNRTISSETFASVIIQFRALGLIDKGTRKRPVTDKENYWSLTPRGESHLVKLLAKRRSTPENSGETDTDDFPF